MKSQQKIFRLFGFLILWALPGILFPQNLDTLISVGKHKLHFNIWQGEGIPILFESGGGNDASIWNPFLGPLHEITGATLITYDRPGYGQSEMTDPDAEHRGISKRVQTVLRIVRADFDESVHRSFLDSEHIS